jgi:cytidylate kinase
MIPKFENYCFLINNFNLNEASDYEFNPSEAATRLKAREKENIQRYRAAQDRGDNYAIELYELKIKMDKIDLEGLKVQTAIHQLKQKNGK